MFIEEEYNYYCVNRGFAKSDIFFHIYITSLGRLDDMINQPIRIPKTSKQIYVTTFGIISM